MIAIFSYVKDCHRQEASDNFCTDPEGRSGTSGGKL